MTTAPTVFPQVVLTDQSGSPYDATNPQPVSIAGSSTFTSGATATAAAPTYTEGATEPLSMDLGGALRISGTINATSAAEATAAAPSYSEGTSNAFSQNLTGDLRVIAKQSGTWTVDGTGGTFPVTGTFWQTTQPVSAASLPLPSGAATSAKQPALGTAGSASADVISVQGVASMTALKVDGSGVTQPVSAASLPLPTGASTSALQTTGNTSVASIDTKTPALGQALAAASVPVVLTSAQITTLTPPTSVTANIGTTNGLALDTTLAGVLTASDFDSKTGSLTETAPATDTASSGLNGRLQRIAQRLTTLIGSTIAISASSLPLPTGAATSAKQPALGTAGSASADVISVQGIASMTALKVDGSAVTQPVSGTVTANAGTGTMAVSIATAPVLVAGSAIIGKVGIDQTTPATTNGVVENATSAAGGITSTARLVSSANSTNATNVKTSAGRIYSIQGKNAAVYDVYLVLYDSATNPPVPGTTTIRKKVLLPSGSAFALDWPVGMSFANGIGYALTKLVADADTTAVAVADVLALNIDYV